MLHETSINGASPVDVFAGLLRLSGGEGKQELKHPCNEFMRGAEIAYTFCRQAREGGCSDYVYEGGRKYFEP